MTNISKLKKYALLSVSVLGFGLTQSCTENIDMSDRYTFTEYTVESYLASHDTTYSEYYKLLSMVPISPRSESSVLQLMSARGNFTVFAPNNKAIQTYLDSLCSQGIIDAPSWDGFRDQQTLDSIRKVIVYNSIIDGKDETEAYQTSSFPNPGEEFMISNLNDRKLTVDVGRNADSIYINGKKDKKTGQIVAGSLIDLKNRDIVAINGCIHQMHQVVAPTTESVGDVLKKYIDVNDERFSITAKLIQACGLFDTLSKVKDETWERMYLNSEVKDLPKHPTEKVGLIPAHRYYGYTIFAETNTVWEKIFNKSADKITVEEIKDWIVGQQFYPEAKDNGNYRDVNNVLNQFVTYHILPVKLPTNKLVIHYNEKGYYYNPSSNQHTIPVWELHTTMGKRRLLKIYEGDRNVQPKGAIYLNRFPELDNGRHGKYYETSCNDKKQGIIINTTEFEDPINGYIYPIEDVLVYDDATRENLQKQRLRFDVAGLFPEFMNNDIRDNRVSDLCTGIPESSVYRYLEDLDIADGTQFYYLRGLGRAWQNLQGDEINVVGSYEMTFKMPPVPKKGIYEIRYAVQNNSDHRGMCQVYFGSDKHRMPAIGIPLDLRIGGTSDLLGWLADNATDDDYNAEVDKKMRNNGFMKGSEYYHAGTASSPMARATQTTTRRIIVRQEMDPDKTYYLKFKTVLEDRTKQFYMDYIEFCAKEVYDNPNTPEDIW